MPNSPHSGTGSCSTPGAAACTLKSIQRLFGGSKQKLYPSSARAIAVEAGPVANGATRKRKLGWPSCAHVSATTRLLTFPTGSVMVG
eukprot:156648-Chlamydomonas_euryale.AAC.4